MYLIVRFKVFTLLKTFNKTLKLKYYPVSHYKMINTFGS